jgi:hypothetical protein
MRTPAASEPCAEEAIHLAKIKELDDLEITLVSRGAISVAQR